MAYLFKILKSESGKASKRAKLPRVGFIVDAFGFQVVLKHAEVSFPKLFDKGLSVVKDLKNKVENAKPVKKAASKAAAAKKSAAVTRAAEVAAEIGAAAGR